MTVDELIHELKLACGSRDPRDIEVVKVVKTFESSWGFSDDWELPVVDYKEEKDYPRVVLIK